MKKKATYYIMALALLIPMSATQAESIVDNLIPKSPTEGLSPNARSFQRYGEIPVSLYTGTPDISIPLTTLSDGAVSLPVSLSYHSGGIKADEHPGWTGLGWTLMLGGVITREVRDLPDETYDLGYLKRCTELKYDLVNPSNTSQLLSADVNYSAIDTEPDKFNFNFYGYSGYFILDPHGKWQIFCDKPLKVEVDAPSLPAILFPNGSKTYHPEERIFKRFVLTDERGIEYVFGNDAIDLSIPSRAQLTEFWAATAWHLVEIRQPDGYNIIFSYERGDFIVNFSDVATNITLRGQNYYSLSRNSGMLISPVYLTGVSSRSFSVALRSSESKELDYSALHYQDRQTIDPQTTDRLPYCPYAWRNLLKDETKWRQLDAIIFKTPESIQYMSVDFSYSSSARERLTLKGIQIKRFDPTASEKYSFAYNNIDSMPEYLSGKTDHWGYFNDTICEIYSRDYKKTNARTVSYGALNEIVYPTGGKTVFEFEPNYYTKIAGYDYTYNSDQIAGGIRVKRIINMAMDGSRPEIRRFVYSGNYSAQNPDAESPGCGILEGKPIHMRSIELIRNNKTFYADYESTQSLGALENNYGCHIAYPEVTEIKADSGYTVNTFISPTDPGFRDEWPIVTVDSAQFVPHTLKGHYRGKPTSTTHYDAEGKRVSSETITYGIIGGEEKWVPAFYKDFTNLTHMYDSNMSEFYYFISSFYKNYIHTLAETSRIQNIYSSDGVGQLSVEHHKRYNSDGQLMADSTVTKRGENRDTEVMAYKYLWETDVWYETKHIKNLYSEVKVSRNGHVTDHLQNRYDKKNGKLPVIEKITEVYGENDRHELYQCLLSNERGQPVHVVDASGMHIVYLWGKDYLYPVAEIKNPDLHALSSILSYGLEKTPDDPDIQGKIETMRQQMPQCIITSYTYEPYLGIKSITDPSGKTTYYDYDLQGRLTTVRDMRGEIIEQYDYETYSGPSTGKELQPIKSAKP